MTFSYTDETGSGIRITPASYDGTVVLEDDFALFPEGTAFAANTYTDTAAMAGKTLIKVGKMSVEYLDLENDTKTEECSLVFNGGETEWNDDWYAVKGNITVSGQITVTGDVNLILMDGCKLDAQNTKVADGNSLTIWPQKNGTGALVAKAPSDHNYAGIGGADSDCGAITINGGRITATGAGYTGQIIYSGAGIGGANGKKGGTITINRGEVTATAGNSGAAIGGGFKGNAGTITINGGTVTANANKNGNGAAIGNGAGNLHLPEAGTITITGGTVIL